MPSPFKVREPQHMLLDLDLDLTFSDTRFWETSVQEKFIPWGK